MDMSDKNDNKTQKQTCVLNREKIVKFQFIYKGISL